MTKSIQELAGIEADAGRQLLAATTRDELRAAESSVLGKKSALARSNAQLGGLPPEDRKRLGQAINDTRLRLSEIAAVQSDQLEAEERTRRIADERLDLTEV